MLSGPLQCERNLTHSNMGAAQSEVSPSKGENAELVKKIQSRLAAVDKEKAKAIGGIFLVNIIKGTSVYSWTLDLNKVVAYEGEPEDEPDTTFTLNEYYFKQLALGKAHPRTIIQAGKCSVTGDIMRVMQLERFVS